MISVLLLGTSVQAAEYFVDATNGTDKWNTSGSAEKPFATIQKAVDKAQAGDTITVLPGVYYGPIRMEKKGTAEKPITLRAQNKGEYVTTITGANKNVREGNVTWTCYDATNNIWVIDYTVTNNMMDYDDGIFPARVLCDYVDVMAHRTLESLQTGIFEKDDDAKTYYPGYKQGYYYDYANKKLYIKLRTDGKYGSSNPNDHCIKVAPDAYKYISSGTDGSWLSGDFSGSGYRGDVMGEDSFNICVGDWDSNNSTSAKAADSYYVIIDGFTFETPGYAGVYTRASDVTIKNCYFRGCRTGVRGAARNRSEDLIYSKNITIEHCDYGDVGVYDEAIELINEVTNPDKTNYRFADIEAQGYKKSSYYWWQRKTMVSDGLKHLGYEVGGFTNNMGEDWTLRYNYIHDCFDGLSHRAMQRYQEDVNGYKKDIPCENIEIYGNVFEKCLDNGIELENHGTGINVYENFFHNNHSSVSWQPENGTPWPTNIKFYKNVIHNDRDYNVFWSKKAELETDAFKIMAPKTANTGLPWSTDIPLDENGKPTEVKLEGNGFSVFNNTIIMPSGGFMKGVGSGMSGVPHKGFKFKNNVVVSDVWSVDEEYGDEARVYTSAFQGAEFAGNVFSNDSLAKFAIVDDFVGDGGKYVNNSETLGFKDITRLKINPELKSDSVLIGAGVTDANEPAMSSDVGALEFGESFDIISNAGCQVK